MNQPILLKSICKSFDEKIVLRNVDITFEKGSCTCIMGESGCGKTTLLNIIMGILPVDSGSLQGVPKNISAVFQEDRLCESFSAVSNIYAATGKKLQNYDILDELGLSDSKNIKVSALSGGMRRRVAIARALMAESDLLILDEPFSALDDATKEQTAKVILKYAKGKTIIVTTHDVRDAEMLNSRVIKLQ